MASAVASSGPRNETPNSQYHVQYRSNAGNDVSDEVNVEAVSGRTTAESGDGSTIQETSFWVMQKILYKKNMYLGWVRRRMWQISWSISVSMFSLWLIYSLMSGIDQIIMSRIMALILPFYLVTAMFPLFQYMVVDVVSEKETKMKEIMHIYGISDYHYWLGWLACYGTYALCCCFLMMIVLTYVCDVFEDSNILMVFILFFTNYCALLSLAFSVSVVFNRAKSASVGASVTLIVLQGLYAWVVSLSSKIYGHTDEYFMFGFNLLTCLVPNFAFSHILTRVVAGQIVNSQVKEHLELAKNEVQHRVLRLLWQVGDKMHEGGPPKGPTFGTEGVKTFHHKYDWFSNFVTEKTESGGRLKSGNSQGIPIEIFNKSFWHSDDPSQLAYCWLFLMLFLSCVIYFYMALWLDKHWQGEFGSKKGLWRCLSWVNRTRVARRISGNNVDTRTYRAEPTLVIGSNEVCPLSLNNLTKKFGDHTANDKLSFDVKSGEIFALLGHNGAGKTTLINMLVGMLAPTEGDASVMGYSIRDDLDAVRRNCSICPQDNPIWPELSVRQHLTFFAIARGEDSSNLQTPRNEALTTPNVDTTVIEKYARALGIHEKLDTQCKQLSGGQKRRLWVATALMGKTHLCILDEPTSGMDPQSRRDLWVLLQKMAKEMKRSIVFSTHYLEEADFLADRKVVLAHGQVKAIGTSNELKKRFGCGYWVNIVIDKSKMADKKLEDPSQLGTVFTKIRELLQTSLGMEHLPKSRKNRFVADSLHDSFLVPWENVDNLGVTLDKLENNMDALLIQDYSIEMTSLEEVFIKLGEPDEVVQDPAGVADGVDTISTATGPRSPAGSDGTNATAITSRGNRSGDVNATAIAVNNSPPVVQRTSSEEFLGSQQRMDSMLLDKRVFSPPSQISGMFWARLQLFKNNRKGTFGQFVYPLLIQVFFLVFQIGVADDADNPLGKVLIMIMCIGGLASQLLIAFVGQCVQDKEKRIKHLTFSHGLSPRSFWTGTCLAHYCLLVIGFLIVPVCITVTRMEPFYDSSNASTDPNSRNPKMVPDIFLDGFPVTVFILFSLAITATLATLLWGYCLSYLFKRQETALKVVPVGLMLSNLAPLICVAVFLIQGIFNEKAATRGKIVHAVASFTLPVYSVSGSMLYMAWFVSMNGKIPTTLTQGLTKGMMRGNGKTSAWNSGDNSDGGATFNPNDPESLFKKMIEMDPDDDKAVHDSWENMNSSSPEVNPFEILKGLDDLDKMSKSAERGNMDISNIDLEALRDVIDNAETSKPLPNFPQTASRLPQTRTSKDVPETWHFSEDDVQKLIEGLGGHDIDSKDMSDFLENYREKLASDRRRLQISYQLSDDATDQPLVYPKKMEGNPFFSSKASSLMQKLGRKHLHPPSGTTHHIQSFEKNGTLHSGPRTAKTTLSEWFDPRNFIILGLIGSICQIFMYGCLLIFVEHIDYHRKSCKKRHKNEEAAQIVQDREMTQLNTNHPFKDDDVLTEEKRQGKEHDVIRLESLAHKYKRHKALDASAAFTAARAANRVSPTDGSATENSAEATSMMVADPAGSPAQVLSEEAQRLYNVDKSYLWAVNGMTFGIPRGECFGLLGPNGAGKTTTLSLLTGETRPPTEGTAFINIGDAGETDGQLDIRKSIGMIFKGMGITPQFDCLWEHMTGREHLRLYSKFTGTYYEENDGRRQPGLVVETGNNIRDLELGSNNISTDPLLVQGQNVATTQNRAGNIVPASGSNSSLGSEASSYGERKIAALLEEVGLSQEDGDKCSQVYSGGMKRKLSLALTFVTSPRVVFLDEPSCGVDVMAKRTLWNKIYRRPENQTVVMTTHSMEEADALCNRVGIMVNGYLRCLGSSLHIKNKYGNGYHLELLLDISSYTGSQPVEEFLTSDLSRVAGIAKTELTILERADFSDIRLKLTIGLAPNSQTSSTTNDKQTGGRVVRLGRIFQWCTDNKHGFIEDYSLGQPTLEQVFLRFAKQQEQITESDGAE